jgi:two-component system cell cycle sensor histidine kinase/response regulator CckA
MRSTAIIHWTSRWRAFAVAAAAAGVFALLSVGLGDAAIALLAGVGVMAAVLFGTGQIGFTHAGAKLDGRVLDVLNALPGAFAVSDKRGAILWENAAFAAALGGPGIERELARLGERDSETAAALFRLLAAAKSGKSHEEAVSLLQSGRMLSFRFRASPLTLPRNGGGRFLIWHIEESSAGSSLNPSRELLESLPFPALSVRDFGVEDANGRLETLLGFSPSGRPVGDVFLNKRGQPLTRGRFKEAASKGPGPLPVQLSSVVGTAQPVSLYISGDADGQGAAIWAALPSIAGEEAAEAAFETLLLQAPISMAFANPKGIVLRANAAFAELFSTNADPVGLTGKALSSLIAAPSARIFKDRISGFALASGPSQVELTVSLKRSADKWVRLVMFPAAHGGNLIVAAFDADQNSQIDEQVSQSQKLQAVGELAGGIAHDFNNLLTGIIGPSDLLLSRFRPSDPAFKDLMDIKNNATRAAELVKQILAYSRRQTLRPAVLKFTDVIEEFQATMGRTLGEKVKAKVQHGRDLWFVKADEGQLFQVIMNLTVNARDAMPDGGEITIRTANVTERESLALKERGLDRGEYVLCEVSDTGTGIRPEHLEKIFDPFFSTKDVGKGTGLGLSTVYGIVKQTGGAILVDSQLGVGTTFRIYLPRYVESEQEAFESKPEASSKHKPETAARLADLTGQGTVLVVEDEDAVRSFTSRALTTRGYTVLEASSGIEALEIMERQGGKVDLVVSDVVMPEMDGPTLLRHLREKNPDIKIVFMSGYAEEAFRKNLSEDEDFVFLPKPFNLKTLAETVKMAVAA